MEKVVSTVLRVTERRNELAKNLDILPVSGMHQCLRAVHSQIYGGWGEYPCVYDDEIVQCLTLAGNVIAKTIVGEDALCVFGGNGTSGRIGSRMASRWNDLLVLCGEKPVFDFLLGGGMQAMVSSVESPEDYPEHGKTELEGKFSDSDIRKILYVGISCGMSSLYVGGQLECCLNEYDGVDMTAALVGFNPINLARSDDVPYWPRGNFRKLLEELIEKKDDFLLLNPIVGPEAIQGSSRLKGGSGTIVLLEVMMMYTMLVHDDLVDSDGVESNAKIIRSLLQDFHLTSIHTYNQSSKIVDLCERAGDCLKNGGHVYYFGGGEAGIWGLIDASECGPTFDSDYNDIRGFLCGGWNSMGVSPDVKKSLRRKGNKFHISVDDFEKEHLDMVTKKDLIIFLGVKNDCCEKDEIRLRSLHENIIKKKKDDMPLQYCIWIGHGKRKCSKTFQYLLKQCEKTNCFIHIEIPIDDLTFQSEEALMNKRLQLLKENADLSKSKVFKHLCEYSRKAVSIFSLKLVLNMISNCAHVIRGVVYENIMVNVRLANTKLVQRAVQIIADLAEVSPTQAKSVVLKILFEGEKDDELEKKTLTEMVKAAATKKSVIPLALMMLLGGAQTQTIAQKMLEKEAILRNALKIVTRKK